MFLVCSLSLALVASRPLTASPSTARVLLSRREAALALAAVPLLLQPGAAHAAKSCMLDCEENCNRVAPGSIRYCESQCTDYCDQDDRRDGLSGSVSAKGAEVGWASAYDPTRFIPGAAPRAVPYGEDRPPALPDLFGVGPQLRRAVTGGARPVPGERWSVEGKGGVQ